MEACSAVPGLLPRGLSEFLHGPRRMVTRADSQGLSCLLWVVRPPGGLGRRKPTQRFPPWAWSGRAAPSPVVQRSLGQRRAQRLARGAVPRCGPGSGLLGGRPPTRSSGEAATLLPPGDRPWAWEGLSRPEQPPARHTAQEGRAALPESAGEWPGKQPGERPSLQSRARPAEQAEALTLPGRRAASPGPVPQHLRQPGRRCPHGEDP